MVITADADAVGVKDGVDEDVGVMELDGDGTFVPVLDVVDEAVYD